MFLSSILLERRETLESVLGWSICRVQIWVTVSSIRLPCREWANADDKLCHFPALFSSLHDKYCAYLHSIFPAGRMSQLGMPRKATNQKPVTAGRLTALTNMHIPKYVAFIFSFKPLSNRGVFKEQRSTATCRTALTLDVFSCFLSLISFSARNLNVLSP